MVKSLTDRLQDDEENIIDRRKISADSRKKISEHINHQEYNLALEEIFEVLTGEETDKYPPTRNISGYIDITDKAKEELNNRNLRVNIVIDSEERTSVISDSETEYTFRDYENGEYKIDVLVDTDVVYEYTEDDLERIEYEIDSVDISIESNTVVVDTEKTDFASVVSGPKIILEDMEIGEEI